MSKDKRTEEAFQMIEQGVKDVYTSENLINYLQFMSRFHSYSLNNCILIFGQYPNASLVAGYNSWNKNFHRHVNKGKKGIKILAPTNRKVKRLVDGMEFITSVFKITQGITTSIMTSVGIGATESTVLPDEIINAVESVGFMESIPLWAVTLLDGIFITVLSFVMILTVDGRFSKLCMYAAISPIPLASMAGESTQNIAVALLSLI